MKREVYINGKLVDSPQISEGIILNNSMFIDLSSFLANRTTKLTVLKTERTLSALKDVFSIDSENYRFYRSFRVDVYVDSKNIIFKGCGLIESVSDNELNLSVTFGAFIDGLELLEQSLRELPDTLNVQWDNLTPFVTDFATDYGFFYFASVVDENGVPPYPYPTIQYIHPSIRAIRIFEEIASANGYTFEYGTSGNESVDTLLRRFIIPCQTKNVSESDIATLYSTNGIPTSTGDGARITFNFTGSNRTFQDGTYFRFENNAPMVTEFVNLKIRPINPNWQNWRMSVSVYYYNAAGVPAGSQEIITNWNEKEQAFVFNEKVEIDVSDDNLTTQYTSAFIGSLRYYNNGAGSNPFVLIGRGDRDNSVFVDGTIRVYRGDNQTNYGENFPIVPNLPDMSQMDFIKNMMFLCGLYAEITGENTIRFDYINGNANYSQAQNIEQYRIESQGYERTFTFDVFAKNNYFRYAEDENVRLNADYSFRVYNDNLENEKDIVELEFAPSDSFSPSAVIIVPLYQLNEDGTYTFIGGETSQRIGYSISANNAIGLGFDNWLTFDIIVSEKYGLYYNIADNMKVLNVTLNIDAVTLSSLNINRPVYYGGQYWIVIDAKNSGDTTAFSLIRLNRAIQ